MTLNIKNRIWALTYATSYTMMALPLCLYSILFVTVWEIAIRQFRRLKRSNELKTIQTDPKTVLLTCGPSTTVTALHLARCLGRAGHRVLVASSADCKPTTPVRFCQLVDRVFVLPPAAKREEYVGSLVTWARRERVQWFIPLSDGDEAATADVRAGLRMENKIKEIKCLMPESEEAVRKLTDQSDFVALAKEAGLAVLEPSRTIFGRQFVANAIFVDGQALLLQVSSKFPSQEDYVVREYPAIRKWIKDFGQKSSMSGLLSVEFVEDMETGVVMGTKCRATLHPSFVGFNSSSKIDVALRSGLDPYFGKSLDASHTPALPLEPAVNDAPKTFFLFDLLLGLPSAKSKRNAVITLFHRMLTCREALLSGDDPWPFMAANALNPVLLFLTAAATGGPWNRYDHRQGVLV